MEQDKQIRVKIVGDASGSPIAHIAIPVCTTNWEIRKDITLRLRDLLRNDGRVEEAMEVGSTLNVESAPPAKPPEVKKP